ncbi:MAG: MBL fold metallo-hydrolase [Candidatus Saccharibacteria bacterium]|nr:MBL fold metallo-hydrolase [Candidatus Saccharibacteria bacterium]
MEIEYKGATTITIKSGPAINVVIDPKLSSVGLKDIKLTDVIEIVTDAEQIIDNDQKILISGAGEYEVAGVSIKGISIPRYKDPERKVTAYKIEFNGTRIAVLGHVSDTLDEVQLENIGVIDVLALPVGGNGYTLDSHAAAKIVNQIDPKIVIPTHYKDAAVKYSEAQDDLESFLKDLGAQEHEVVDKLKIKNGAMPAVRTVFEIKRS